MQTAMTVHKFQHFVKESTIVTSQSDRLFRHFLDGLIIHLQLYFFIRLIKIVHLSIYFVEKAVIILALRLFCTPYSIVS